MTEAVSPAAFSEFSAQDNALAVREAQEWIQAVTGRNFSSSFRESLEDGVILCELMSKLRPGSIRKINKSKSPIAHLDNIQQFLSACQDLGLKDAQLFDTMDLQDAKGKKRTGVKRNEADRRVRSVCITLYWLGQAMAQQEDYTGPQLDLKAFRRLMDGVIDDSDEDSNGPISNQTHVHFQLDVGQQSSSHRSNSTATHNGSIENGFNGLTFEQEQTADQLMADIQSAVDEMLQDFDLSPVPDEMSPRAHSPPDNKRLGVSLHMSSRNGGFGFQVNGGVDTGTSPRVELIVPGSASEDAGLMTGDELVSVNKQDISQLTHLELVARIKKAGEEGSVLLGLIRTVTDNSSPDGIGVNQPSYTVVHASKPAPPIATKPVSKKPALAEPRASSDTRSSPERTITAPADIKPVISRPPPTSFIGGEPLDTLVETQDEALLEQINEMLQSIPPPESPTPSPPPSPSSLTLSPPDKFSMKHTSTATPKKPPELPDDRESIERELQEIILMEMNAATAAADSASPPKTDQTDSLNFEREKTLSVSPVGSDNDIDKQISDLLNFAGFEPVPKIPTPSPPPVVSKPESPPMVKRQELPPHQVREMTMLESPPPPMPKTEAPKRQVKSSPPPLTKPKPSKTKRKPESSSSSAAPKVSLLSKKTRITAAEQKEPPKPTNVPLSNGPLSMPPSVSMKQAEPAAQSRVMFTPPPPPTSPPPGSINTQLKVRELGTVSPENIEIFGDLKISCVEKKRWTPKGNEVVTPPALTPEQQLAKHLSKSNHTTPVNHTPISTNHAPLSGRYSKPEYMKHDLPNNNLRRDDPLARISASTYHLPQHHQMNSGPTVTPVKRTQWKSQEELRIRNVKQSPPTVKPTQHAPAYRQQSTPVGTSYASSTMQHPHHQQQSLQKVLSLPRGKMMETWKKNRSSTWAVRDRNRTEGPQIAYAVHANSPQELCSRCHRPLGAGIVMAVPGPKSQYHVQCFVCRSCHTPLVRGPQNTTVVIKNLQPHCGFCASNANKGVIMTEC